ncbi:MAG: rhodanese-like domain-containing protein [Bacteroidales bacterium]|nr:rhodanese-like domain-containing protein [Bacteroidales bacterium]
MTKLLTLALSMAFLMTFFLNLFKKDNIKIISPKKFQTEISKDNVQLIDVRTKSEFDEGHIKDAALLNVQDSISFADGVNDFDKEKPVYIYCRSGKRSHKAALIFDKSGFKVYELKGGILNWKNSDLPLEP